MLAALGLAVLTLCCGGATADELEVRASWSMPDAATSRQTLVDWLKGEPDSETSLLKLDVLWPPETDLSADAVLPKLTETVAALHEPASELLNRTSAPASPGAELTAPAVLDDEKLPVAIRANLRLAWTKWLVENQFLDEALESSAELKTEEVVDPAGLLFYRSVAYHRLLKKDECLPELTRLLENEDVLPRRYRTVAKLMAADLKPLQTDTLDEVARLMSDVRRRLDLGRGRRPSSQTGRRHRQEAGKADQGSRRSAKAVPRRGGSLRPIFAAHAGQPARRGHRPRKRRSQEPGHKVSMGRLAAQGTRSRLARDHQGAARPLPLGHRRVLPQAGADRSLTGASGRRCPRCVREDPFPAALGSWPAPVLPPVAVVASATCGGWAGKNRVAAAHKTPTGAVQ